MLRSIAARTTFGALAAVVAAGLVSIAATPTASAAPFSGETGSIIYDRGGDVYQTTPDGSGTHRVTTNGATPTADKTGSTGYAVPTESDGGLIAAVRNQDYGGYSQGFIWVMDRNGTVIDKFKPPQFSVVPQFEGCSGPDAQLPQGIVNASISPDGKHVAYTATAIGNDASCGALSEVGSWITDIDGSHGHWLSAAPAGTADLEIGRWVTNSRLLIDRFDFGSIENFYVDLPSYTATAWSAPASGDFIDEAYLQPDVANGVLVTDGYSEYASAPVIRIWSTTGFGSAPTAQCEYASVAHPGTTHVNLNQPSLSPDGAEVVYEDYDDPTSDATNEGIYIAPAAGALASTQACADANPSLFVQGAEDPFWTPASTAQLPSDTTAPAATLTAPNDAATIGASVTLTWTGHDDYSGIAYYQLRERTAPYSAGFTSWSTPSSWQHLTGNSVTRSGLARGKDYCFKLRAVDNAGNMSSWTAPRCTAVPLDDRSLSRAPGWTTGTGSNYYAGTITSTTKKGATLTRTNAEVHRIAAIATTCPQCGSVNVYVGSHRVGTLDLHGSRTKHQVLKSLPAFSVRSGTVKLTVTTTGKTVAIDGLLLSRT
jgi:hypothetical protein